MRPLMLKGGERSLTKVVFNREGDLLFSSSKDKEPFVWFSENGERLGTYQGHKGAVWDIDVSYDSRHFVSGAGDNHCILWDTETGKRLAQLMAPTVVRCVGFSYSGDLFFFTTLSQMKKDATLNIVDMRDSSTVPWTKDGGDLPQLNPAIQLLLSASTYSALWSHLDTSIITGDEKGVLNQFDIRKPDEPVNFDNTTHKKRINDLQLSADQTMLLSSSKDQTSRLWDPATMTPIKCYKSERPVNSASISPLRDHIILGGGEEAMTVPSSFSHLGEERVTIGRR